MADLPRLALSVRQPSAWAIIHGGKVIENRTLDAIRAGRMTPGKICIHAATGMKQDEFRYLSWRLAKHGVICPRPDALVRGAIIGTVEVTAIITESDSEWFGGTAGLLLADARPVDPIPASGALGYFEWTRAPAFAPAKPWMKRFDRPNADSATGALFPDAAPTYEKPPRKPWGKG
ncbi:ASCH domain-containing protein [Roseobacter weihaiensis]|uniref:hypothetical protein n=1 Tax=Roseobacter weihaiensis TaxID=2763262 RepID=UPI001D0A6AEB|nr:hypothetical protein [Roseobacter sp. H9]